MPRRDWGDEIDELRQRAKDGEPGVREDFIRAGWRQRDRERAREKAREREEKE